MEVSFMELIFMGGGERRQQFDRSGRKNFAPRLEFTASLTIISSRQGRVLTSSPAVIFSIISALSKERLP
jgi:hypothetical protein